MTDELDDRVLGSLYAVALGDAMGMPGELWPRSRVLDHFGRIDRFLPGPVGHFVVDGYRAGQITDDTQQTVMLAEAIIDADGAVDADVVSRHLVAWADRVGASEGNFLGPSSARAIQALRDGAPPSQTGVKGETNGAAMRIAPVGLISPSADLPVLVDRVEAASLMSHHTHVAIAGASLVAGVVSAAVDAGPGRADGAAVADALEVGFRAAELGMQRGELVVAPSIVARARMAQELAAMRTGDDAFLQELYDLVGASVATIDSVPAAVGLVTRAAGDPLRCALLAANLGGDTDTIGAIAGGMCGAISGFSSIPGDLVATLDDVNGIDLRPIAAALAGFRRRNAANAPGA